MRLGRRIRTHTLRERRRQIVIEGMAYLLAIAGSVILLLSQLSMLDALQIHTVHIRGNKATPSSQLLAVIQKDVWGHYLHLFSRGNILLFPRFAIERDVLEQFPRIASADIDVENFTTISLTVTERDAVAEYCTTDTTCFFLDEGGFIFAPAPVVSGASTTWFVYRGVRHEHPVGEHLLTTHTFQELHNFVSSVETLGITPAELVIVGENEYRLVLSGGAEIIFDPADGYSQILENLRIVLGANELSTRLADGRLLEVDYIDLRYGNKVFYRLEEGVGEN